MNADSTPEGRAGQEASRSFPMNFRFSYGEAISSCPGAPEPFSVVSYSPRMAYMVQPEYLLGLD